jgi:hypothetical protein
MLPLPLEGSVFALSGSRRGAAAFERLKLALAKIFSSIYEKWLREAEALVLDPALNRARHHLISGTNGSRRKQRFLNVGKICRHSCFSLSRPFATKGNLATGAHLNRRHD